MKERSPSSCTCSRFSKGHRLTIFSVTCVERLLGLFQRFLVRPADMETGRFSISTAHHERIQLKSHDISGFGQAISVKSRDRLVQGLYQNILGKLEGSWFRAFDVSRRDRRTGPQDWRNFIDVILGWTMMHEAEAWVQGLIY
jgi:hypothetical protein